MSKTGIVYLVGAGPGDPGLITLKAVECLRQADVILYDYLANKVFLSYAKPKAAKIYVGKKGGIRSHDQDAINSLLVEEARKGRTVVRLKGGDPFVFGRGGEEVEALAKAKVSFEVVPGVTSSIAVPAYAGIPVTHRDYTSSVTFVTGHAQDIGGAEGKAGEMTLDWKAISRMGTIVFLMGYKNLPHICEKLIGAGRDPETPAAVIEWGTLPQQKVAVGTLKTIPDEMKKAAIRPPTITVIGPVVSLRETLSWFEKKPLFGKKILVTRSSERAGDMAFQLETQGAQVFQVPTMEFRPPQSWRTMDQAIRNLSRYDWLVFTSGNGVEFFFKRLQETGCDLRHLGKIRMAVVGPATAQRIEERGFRPDLVAKEFQAEGLARAFRKFRMKGKKILWVRAREAREVLAESLRKMGARVSDVEAYRQVLPAANAKKLSEILTNTPPDLVVFASSNMARNYLKLAEMAKVGEKARRISAACIGPITEKTAREIGLNVVLRPKRSTTGDLVKAIRDFFSR